MIRYLKYSLLIGAGWLISCNNQSAAPARSTTVAAPYFNLNEFIAGQVKQLETTRAQVEKKVSTQPGSPETTLLPQVNWARELETFSQADINKPALRAAYDISKLTTSDGQSKTTYRKRAGYRDATVEYLEVSLSPEQRVIQISGKYREDNYLVSSAKDFSLTCAPVNGKNQIATYQISGTQKTIFFDPLRYQVQATIR
ncbi:hypothetical protein [Adhaeribacter radiodurans]|uniref:Lipoprotein n=1 Tax=Adhaeribacter radiodurans TaxID=2745197 RepID=A0A7L7LF26_9BACT|nr:hypothetical protein [Adhaeribacter radiodurans]QMU30979.1 hypothetical protein HUW48_24450 [Adhaeribacter radiodurans]